MFCPREKWGERQKLEGGEGGGGDERKRLQTNPPCPPHLSLFPVFWLSPQFSRGQNTENPVPRSFFAPQPNGSACYSQATVIVVCYSFVLRYRKLQSSSGQLSLPINVLRLCRLSIVAFVASSFRKCLEHVVAKRVIAALYSLLVCSFVSVFLFCCKLELERIVKAKKKIKKALLSVPRICFKQPG